jgi:D-alanyl-D-alanine carboxypeptidase
MKSCAFVLIATSLLASILHASQAQAKSSPATLARQMDAFLTQVSRNHLSVDFRGAVLVSLHGKVLLSKGYGLARPKNATHAMNKASTEFQIGAITEEFTAAAILQLRDAGKLTLQAHVCAYIAGCPAAWQQITIAELLDHTSGIHNYLDMSLDFSRPTTPQALLRRIEGQPLDSKPGRSFNYSDSDYAVLGQIVSRVSGLPYKRYVSGHLLVPMGLGHTGFNTDRPPAPPTFAAGTSGFGRPPRRDASWGFSAGGMYSTVGDLLAWNRALFGDKVVSAASLALLTTRHASTGEGYGYGYGLFVGKTFGSRVAFHDSQIPGFVSEDAWYPGARLDVIVLGNNDQSTVNAISDSLAGMVFSAAA